MRARSLFATTAVAVAVAAAVPATAPAEEPLRGVLSSMSCLAPTDSAGLDAMLARAGSPLAGEGATFVAEGVAAGIDPRAVVAIAAHETMLETYGPSQTIRNPFGLGPGIAFDTEADAIARATTTLADYYVPEGRTTLAGISGKWAPVGAANDPGGLNGNWTTGTSTYYAALGGDPDRAILLADQDAAPSCASVIPAPDLAAGATVASAAAPSGPPVVTAWGGAVPAVTGPGAAGGTDPATGAPATLDGFVFPLALPAGAPAVYRDAFGDAGPGPAGVQQAITIATAPGAHAVAAVAGTLHAADAAARESGIAFWIDTPGGDRVGYGPLLSYAGGVGEGAPVAAGARLGDAPTTLRIAWERAGQRIDPFPLLSATRPSSS